jgi:hypothetical protein
MSEQVECEKEESQADKAVKKLIEYKKQDQKRAKYGGDNAEAYVEFDWRSVGAKVKVLGFIDFCGSIWTFYEAATLGNPSIAVAAFLALVFGLYLMS